MVFIAQLISVFGSKNLEISIICLSTGKIFGGVYKIIWKSWKAFGYRTLKPPTPWNISPPLFLEIPLTFPLSRNYQKMPSPSLLWKGRGSPLCILNIFYKLFGYSKANFGLLTRRRFIHPMLTNHCAWINFIHPMLTNHSTWINFIHPMLTNHCAWINFIHPMLTNHCAWINFIHPMLINHCVWINLIQKITRSLVMRLNPKARQSVSMGFELETVKSF